MLNSRVLLSAIPPSQKHFESQNWHS